jgi:hypothetical protein
MCTWQWLQCAVSATRVVHRHAVGTQRPGSLHARGTCERDCRHGALLLLMVCGCQGGAKRGEGGGEGDGGEGGRDGVSHKCPEQT